MVATFSTNSQILSAGAPRNNNMPPHEDSGVLGGVTQLRARHPCAHMGAGHILSAWVLLIYNVATRQFRHGNSKMDSPTRRAGQVPAAQPDGAASRELAAGMALITLARTQTQRADLNPESDTNIAKLSHCPFSPAARRTAVQELSPELSRRGTQ